MIKLIIISFTGLLCLALGGYFVQLHLSMAAEGSSPVLIGLGGIFIILGGFIIVKGILTYRKARLRDATPDILLPESGNTDVSNGTSILKKNNELLTEWNKTNDARDKLKVLEAAGAAEEGN